MGSCIICGTSVEGYICESHEEDVVFEFEGSRANQLTSGRFYRGSVDGFADFGAFIDIGDSVTGLLHRSELDSRLESLDWDSGDTVYVQVTDVHDNGNVDLTWSIRQSDREFRGSLVDTPEGDELPEEREATDPNEHAAAGRPAADTDRDADEVTTDRPRTDGSASADTTADTDERDETNGTDERDGAALAEAESEPEPDAERERVAIEALESRVGDPVRVEGAVASVRQTGGPTVFSLHDESGTVDCAAFEKAGVRAYPDVEQGEIVAIEGRVERHREDLQIEVSGLTVLDDEERETVENRMEEALAEQAQPEAVAPLAEDGVADRIDAVRDLAGLIRRAVLDSRPVVVRHDASADGYVAASAIERATLPLVRTEHAQSDAEYHYFDRRPLGEGVYDMDSATRDVTTMLDAHERHDEKIPLFVFCGVGGTGASEDGLGLLALYDADRAVIADGSDAGDVEAHVETNETTASALAANVAVHIDPDVRGEVEHLPAVSFWEDTPEEYENLAAEAGYDTERTRDLRESVALVANYQAYEDKRELVADLLFDGRQSLAARLSTQFREKLDGAIETAQAHLERHEVEGSVVNVLDTDAFTHRYDFPPTDLLCDELHRRTREDAPVLLGIDEDELLVRHDGDLDLERLAEETAERAPETSVSVGAAGDRLAFLVGERETVREAALEAVAEQASAA